MKAQELRIGNFVHHNGTWSYRNESIIDGGQDIEIDLSDFYGICECTFYFDDCSGIAINEEWLLKFGFKIQSERVFVKGSVAFEFGFKNYAVFMNSVDGLTVWNRFNHIKFVHEFQNWHYALTGEELTIEK